VYNWLRGRPISDAFAARAWRLRSVVAPIGEEWHPEAFAHWLQKGSPSPIDLAQRERWAELEELVRSASRPLDPQAVDERIAMAEEEEAIQPWPAAALAAVLREFSSPPPVRGRSSSGWRPRELTGSTANPDED
jgi:hypothetical protein